VHRHDSRDCLLPPFRRVVSNDLQQWTVHGNVERLARFSAENGAAKKLRNPININEIFPDDCANFYPVELYFYKRYMGNEKSFFTLCPFWNFCIKEKYDSRDNAFFMLTILTQIKIMHSDKTNCTDIFFYVV